jgi:hypothetical protein
MWTCYDQKSWLFKCHWNLVAIFLWSRFYFIFPLLGLDSSHWTTIGVWTNYDQKSWSFKWQPKFGQHFSTTKIFFNFIFTLLKLDSNHWTIIRVWINCNFKSWLFKWRHKSSWHFSMVKIVSTFFAIKIGFKSLNYNQGVGWLWPKILVVHVTCARNNLSKNMFGCPLKFILGVFGIF